VHELSIASAIVQNVLEFVRTQQAQKVLVVRLAIGELTCLEPEQLQFCYRAVTKETPIEDSTLEIDRLEATVSCPHCGYDGRPKYWDDVATLQCPLCGKTVEAIAGHECAIKAIQYVN